jgi:hypothetical protein
VRLVVLIIVFGSWQTLLFLSNCHDAMPYLPLGCYCFTQIASLLYWHPPSFGECDSGTTLFCCSNVTFNGSSKQKVKYRPSLLLLTHFCALCICSACFSALSCVLCFYVAVLRVSIVVFVFLGATTQAIRLLRDWPHLTHWPIALVGTLSRLWFPLLVVSLLLFECF